MTKESVDAIIEILKNLSEVSETDSETTAASCMKDYFKGSATAFKIAIDVINDYLDYEKGGDI